MKKVEKPKKAVIVLLLCYDGGADSAQYLPVSTADQEKPDYGSGLRNVP